MNAPQAIVPHGATLHHQWSQFFENAVRNSDCPACDAKDIAPVWIETADEAVS